MSSSSFQNKAQLTNRLKEYGDVLHKRIASIHFPLVPENIYAPLHYFLALGGKRMRPTLSLLSCHLFGTPGIKAINVALAIELFHNFTLIHDDIMDNAPLRRGKPTVHTKWDINVAILAGDVLYTKANMLLVNNENEYLPDLFTLFNQTATEVCQGQQMDMDFEKKNSITLSDYLQMIRLKTSVLLGAALEMGAIIASASVADRKHIYEFGVNLGLAFQLQDDILDLYADPHKFGKQIGGDVLANKKTYLLLRAFELADDETSHQLMYHLERGKGEEKIQAVREIFDKMDVRKHAEEARQKFYQAALFHMNAISVNDEMKSDLLQLAKEIMSRDF